MADISGYAIQWGKPAIIANLFEERFARGAFDRSLIDNPDVVVLWSHDTSRPLARVSNKTLTLKSDNIGLWYSFTPNEKSPLGQEAIATIGAGTLDQVSVGFASQEEEWQDGIDLLRRTITRATLFELSMVVWGAYGATTSASLVTPRSTAVAKAEAKMHARGLI